FQRLTVDLAHDFAIYKSTTRFNLSRDSNGPDECSIDQIRDFPACGLDKKVQSENCEKVHGKNSAECKSISRDLQGSFGVRFFLSPSFPQGQRAVPFYFMPTLGGGDLNGATALAS